MKQGFLIVLAFAGGCATADFKVVDALRPGMSREDAQATISSFGFERETALDRPASGWPDSDGTFTNLPGRAHAAEENAGVIVTTAEYYPVGHGLFGFGQLFLFFDADGNLITFYRRQIN